MKVYTTGQAARVLGVSSYIIRRLCETGQIKAQHTGKRWLIPAAEVERLQEEGIP